MVCLSLWGMWGAFKQLEIKQMADKWKSAVTLRWLLRHEYVSYVSGQDEPCDLARWFQGKVGHCDLHKQDLD